MSRKFFGTDGIRGRAGVFPMTADMALKVARATAKALDAGRAPTHHKKRAVIGKDTRLSGYMLEQAMAAGFESAGMDVVFLGPLPTPAVAMFTRSLRADVGVMISASHNPYEDNGIKLFGPDGYKLSDALELEIEALIDEDMRENAPAAPPAGSFGKATRLEDAQGRYIEFLKGTFPRRMTLKGLRVVVDCAHGAAYKIAPQVLTELEAEVIPLGNAPDGLNINAGCGATDPAFLRYKVIEADADIGIALDGDADRLVMVDETGTIIDGDQLMALLAKTMQETGALRSNGIVSTIMSNLGLERFLAARGLALMRTAVGDRYVVEKMRDGDFNLGGEQSGHIVLSDFSTTGDGLLAALQVLAAFRQTGERASTALRLFAPLPQILQNVKFSPGAGVKPLDDESVRESIRKAENTLSNDGRLVIRPSGTEPVIRVMAEGDNLDLIKAVVSDLCAAIERAAGKT